MYTCKISPTVALAALVGFSLAGCNSTANHSEKTPKADEAHAHEHHHHCPHNGHMMELGEEEYHAEWTHDESGKVTFYILDSEAKKEVPIATDKIVIDVKIGDNKPVTYELPAVNTTDGKSAMFEINGKQFDQPIKEHEHGH